MTKKVKEKYYKTIDKFAGGGTINMYICLDCSGTKCKTKLRRSQR